MKRIELSIGLLCVLIVALSLGVGGVKAGWNPMHDRLAEFELEVDAVTYVPEGYKIESEANYDAIVAVIVDKTTLWKELVPPPPPPKPRPRPVKKPDLKKMLEGVVASSRLQIIGAGGRILLDVKTPKDRAGSWLGVGDKVNGVTIKKITKDAVLFSLMSNKKEYTYSLPRR